MGSTVVVLIDLDAPPRAEPEPRTGAAPRRRRTWFGVIVAAALLLLVGGAASPGPETRAPEVVASSGSEAVLAALLGGDALYLAQDLPEDQAVISARPLHPGGPQWQVTVAAIRPPLTMDASKSVVIAGPDRDGIGELVFLDARTGRVRWRTRTGDSALVLGDRVAVWTPGDDGVDRLRMVTLTTGRTIWSRVTDSGVSELDTDAEHRFLVVLDSGFAATILAAADGRVVAGPRELGVDQMLWGVDYPQPFAAATVVGERFYVYGTSFIEAYRLGDLTRLWHRRVASPATELTACGAELCATGPETLTVLDPRTGTVRWIDPDWATVRDGGVLVADSGRSARVDLATGRVLEELGRGAPAGDLMLRSDGDLTWFTRGSDGRVLAQVPRVGPLTCTRLGRYLGCRTTGLSYTVWEVD